MAVIYILYTLELIFSKGRFQFQSLFITQLRHRPRVCNHAALPGQMRITRLVHGHSCECQALRVRQLTGLSQTMGNTL